MSILVDGFVSHPSVPGVTTLVADAGHAIETGLEVATLDCAIALGLLAG